MHQLDLILTLTGGFITALVLGLGTQRLGLSPIVGYLLAGIVVSPHTPGFVANKEMAEQLSEIGVILLMFGVGLQFHFKELLAVRRVAIPGALVQSATATLLGAVVVYGFGWSWPAGVVFGLALSVASTVVLTRVLVDNNHLHTPTGHIAIGWLVVEDLLTVFVLVLLPAIFGPGGDAGGSGIPLALGVATLKIGALVGFTFAVGNWLIPRLLTFIAATGSQELFTLGVLAIALGIAVGSAALFGVSMALGAFLAGMVVGRSDFSLRAATDALPMRDAFAVLFFVSIGMLFDFSSLLESPWIALATLGVILIGKPAAALGLVVAMRYPFRVALSVAMAMAQIGEFSFILAAMGRQLKILPEQASNILVAAAVVSITLNPLLYRTVKPVEAWVSRRPWLWRWLNVHDHGARVANGKPEPDARHRAVIVGFGPVGQTVVRLMKDNDIEPIVVELNLETVQQLRTEGATAVYGDAGHRETLRQAGLKHADVLILSASSIEAGREVIRVARELNPRIRVLARTAYLHEVAALRVAGADRVFTGEGEVALAMTEFILGQFNATREQIDRERDRIRRALFDKKTG
ncbi:Kef-type K+ transport system, predicted NAD-binding component [Opitutaceae bacterium TAV1]|nr:Kef-type K+ transport system, predicted NAD-binding component [Opitutaceae bacterium TAV1]